MSINKQDSRHKIKRTILPGIQPTLRSPTASQDFTDGTWLNTEIRPGEFYFNIPDQRLWIGGPTSVLELTSIGGTSSNNLEQTLLIGNDSGSQNIIMGTGTNVSSNTGGQIDLDYFSSPGEISISTDNGNQNESYLYMTPTDSSLIGGNGGSLSLGTNININTPNTGSLYTRVGTGLTVDGRYSASGSGDIIKFIDNASTSFTTNNTSNKPGIVISSRNSTIGTASYNSAIIGGLGNRIDRQNNVIAAGNNIKILDTALTNFASGESHIISGNSTSNNVSGSQITINDSDSNIVGGSLHILDNSSELNIVGGYQNILLQSGGNDVSGQFHTVSQTQKSNISGESHILTNTFNSNISGTSHIIGTVSYSNISGESHTVISSSYNNVSGKQNTLIGSTSSSVSGTQNTLTNSNYNIVSGSYNTLTGIQNSLVSGTGISATQSYASYLTDIIMIKYNAVPTSSSDPIGVEGSVTYDGTHIYWKSGGSWVRTLGLTF